MNFLGRLDAIVENERDAWNDDIEAFLGKPSPFQNSNSVDFDDAASQSSIEIVAFDLQNRMASSFGNCEVGEYDPNIRSIVRTGKNFLRWYIQIYLEQLQVQRQRHKAQGVCKINILRSLDTLTLVLQILKLSSKENRNLKLAHDASLYIFYATYSHFPGDVSAANGIDHLISHHKFPKECLDILMKTNNVPLASTLIRNLHSITVSFPNARTTILNANISHDPFLAKEIAPWAPKVKTTMNFSQSCLVLLRWSLDANPTFPSDNPEDKRAELVVEILNCFYAMQKGQELAEPTSEFTRDNDNPSLEQLIVQILQLELPARSDSETISKRIVQCKLSAVSLLMDSDMSFGRYLIENDSFETLLEILNHQVDDIVDHKKIDSTATATLVPILTVLNRYSLANSVVLQKVKAFVFPAETETKIQQSIREKRKTQMSPLDAPKDTLRGKLIVLLSWVDGYIKRCSAELMWTLSDSDSSEFTFRVGLGNALPLLSSKGLSPIPIPS